LEAAHIEFSLTSEGSDPQTEGKRADSQERPGPEQKKPCGDWRRVERGSTLGQRQREIERVDEAAQVAPAAAAAGIAAVARQSMHGMSRRRGRRQVSSHVNEEEHTGFAFEAHGRITQISYYYYC